MIRHSLAGQPGARAGAQLQGQHQKGDPGLQMTQVVFPNQLDSRYSFDSQENQKRSSSAKRQPANYDLKNVAKVSTPTGKKNQLGPQGPADKPKLFKNIDIKVKIYQKAFNSIDQAELDQQRALKQFKAISMHDLRLRPSKKLAREIEKKKGAIVDKL